MRDIGKNIKQNRILCGMTQDALAEKLHVTRQTVSNYETGRSRPDIDMLLSIADALEVKADILLYGAPTPPDRRKDIRRLIITMIITALLGAFILWFNPLAAELLKYKYLPGPSFFLGLLFIPAFFTLLGSALMQLSGICLNTKRPKFAFSKALYVAIWVLLCLCFINFLPILLESAAVSLDFTFGNTLGRLLEPLPRAFNKLGFMKKLYVIVVRFPTVFTPAGALLWLFEPTKQEKTESNHTA